MGIRHAKEKNQITRNIDITVDNPKNKVDENSLFANIKKINKNKDLEITKISNKYFHEMINKKIKHLLSDLIKINSLEEYSFEKICDFFNFEKINEKKVLKNFDDFDRVKLDPLMITNTSNSFDTEFYWGEWSLSGEKEGFGIKIFPNGNFYFGTFRKDKMDGLGLYLFEDKSNDIYFYNFENENYNRLSKKDLFKVNIYQSKLYGDLEIQNIQRRNNLDVSIDSLETKSNINYDCFCNINNNKKEYYLYRGEFTNNNFEGFGDIYQNNFFMLGIFNYNRIISEGNSSFCK